MVADKSDTSTRAFENFKMPEVVLAEVKCAENKTAEGSKSNASHVCSSYQLPSSETPGSLRYCQFSCLRTAFYAASDTGDRNTDARITMCYSLTRFLGLPIWDMPAESKQCK
jgi:hypothetical protein